MKAIKRSSAAESMPAFDADHTIKAVDPELWRAIERENRRQHDHIELIASENYVSPVVMQVQGSQLTNKYAEGYPGRRYYGGCEFVDIVEQLAIDRVKNLFGASTPMCSRTQDPRPIRLFIWLCSSRATLFSVCLLHMVGT
jgi:hypothetical protein